MSWSNVAWRTMDEVRINGVKTGKNPAEIAKAIDAAYPFGERKYYPYKAWLSVRKEFFTRHGLPRRAKKTLNADLFKLEATE